LLARPTGAMGPTATLTATALGRAGSTELHPFGIAETRPVVLDAERVGVGLGGVRVYTTGHHVRPASRLRPDQRSTSGVSGHPSSCTSTTPAAAPQRRRALRLGASATALQNGQSRWPDAHP
jgi:hypothetical protein